MAWRVWAVVAIALGGAAFGQAPVSGPQVGDLYSQRTAGQPNRQFRVIRVGAQVEVEDVATGGRYVTTAAVMAGMTKAAPARRQPGGLPSPAAVQSLMAPPPPVAPIRPPVPPRPTVPVYTTVPTLMPPVPPHATPYPSVAAAVQADTQAFADDLANALRPSVRETAATGLAEGRHGWRPEIKQLLANAAMNDPAVSVQVRCVTLLATLGYHEPGYVEFLEAAAGTAPDRLRRAARAALARLATH